MFIINGTRYEGDVTIINGQVINNGSFNNKVPTKKVEETKKQSAKGVKQIIIDSNISVKVSACNTNDVIAHVYGTGIMDRNINLSLERNDDKIVVSTKSSNYNNELSIINTGSTYGAININNNLVLEVKIPNKVFREIEIKSQNGSIDVDSSIYANYITIEGKNGKIDVTAKFQVLTIECKNGNIKVDSEAHCDIDLDVTSKNGNINVSVRNIGISTVLVSSENGKCKNCLNLNSGIYAISGNITSKNGNVIFH